MREVIFHGKMPDPFRKSDGTRVSPEEWVTYKKELLEQIVDMEYGGMPPRPEYLRMEPLNSFRRGLSANWFKIYVGTKEKQVTFTLALYVPYVPGISPGENADAPFDPNEKYPVVLTGDGCYGNMEEPVVEEAHKRGYIAAKFNRLEFANDIHDSWEGGLRDIYPGKYSDMSAWAWGYMVYMDVFKQIIIIIMTSVLVNNYVLSKFLGICPFLGVSKKVNQSTGMGLAVIFVMSLVSKFVP